MGPAWNALVPRLSFWLEQNVRDLMTQQYKMDEMHQLITNDMPLSLMPLARFFWRFVLSARF